MILVRYWGGLGNQMFQYAAARALSEKNNTEIIMDLDLITSKDPNNSVFKFHFELHAFKIKNIIASSHKKKMFLPPTKNVFERMYYKFLRILNPKTYYRQGDKFTEEFWDVKDNTCIEGRFQSEKYFKPYEDIIRKEFEFNIEIPDYVKELEQNIKGTNAVGLQVRRGIIKTPYYYNIMGAMEPTYYHKGLEIISKTQKDIKIFVISDDIEWCKKNLEFDYPTTFLTNDIASNNHHVQLYLLSCCKHFVIPNSTYAWWGAWLSNYKNKIVVAPEKWYLNDWDYKDIVPESWVKI